MNEYINKKLCSKSAHYKCRANYEYIYRTNKTNTSKQLLVSCLHIHQVSCLVFILVSCLHIHSPN